MTTLREAQAASVAAGSDMDAIEETFPKYGRFGHIELNRWCDELAVYAKQEFPGDTLPKRWRYKDPGDFMEKFGKGAKWAVTQNYHCLFYNGQYIMRIWTNSNAKYAWIDLPTHLAAALQLYGGLDAIPEGSLKKCRPMTARTKATWFDRVDLIFEIVREIYGLDS